MLCPSAIPSQASQVVNWLPLRRAREPEPAFAARFHPLPEPNTDTPCDLSTLRLALEHAKRACSAENPHAYLALAQAVIVCPAEWDPPAVALLQEIQTQFRNQPPPGKVYTPNGLHYYDAYQVVHATKGLDIVERDITLFTPSLDFPRWRHHAYGIVKPRDVMAYPEHFMEHQKRCLSAPMLIYATPDHHVIKGMHALVRALREGRTTIRVITVPPAILAGAYMF